ncbi:hypothetical protein BGZ60DRAFT_479702 [Tricladium varicosporioides]|nr:hypothetical protein BGZ60DRAFT_479702 [Hymenoscyphus varicosporioides]
MSITMYLYLLQFLGLTSTLQASSHQQCKATPGSHDWPSDFEWAQLNQTLSGRLIKPIPPGAVCHPDQSTFDSTTCPVVQAGWKTAVWHTNNPVSSIRDNWNNDTCIPIPTAPCSGEGYPIYVINATVASDVKKGVDFARRNNIRLIVKGTGHDYLGRSSAPNSLSIWTHHMRGLQFHNTFQPTGCKSTINTQAITAAAGTQMLELGYEAHLRNLTIVSGGAATVGVGGYLTGGGHAALSHVYGMGADQVLEMEVVTPKGEILIANECQNSDIFWAMRGGGGSTFSVLTSITIRAFPSTPFLASTTLLALPPQFPGYYHLLSSIYAQFPTLSAKGISTYSYFKPNFTSDAWNITSPVNAYYSSFMFPVLSPLNTTESFAAAINEAVSIATKDFPAGQVIGGFEPVKSYPDFWEWYKDHNGPAAAGTDGLLGSRLLDSEALTKDPAKLATALEGAGGQTGMGMFLVGGKGVASKVTDYNSVNPAWRKAFVHAVLNVDWPPLNMAERAKQEGLVTNSYIKALRDLAPDMGAYINEADPNEPNFQHSFWGTNYERLLSIKKKVDPTDVLWCHPCVGNEGWEEVGGVLCRK